MIGGVTGIERYASGGPWEAGFGYSRVVRAGDLVLVAGTTAIDDFQGTGASVRRVPHTAPLVLVASDLSAAAR